MRSIPKERILRVNCPGYGVEANFNLGSAKPLNNYSAIIVNPVSIAHLFDKDPEVVRRIDAALAEGHTTFKIEDDMLLRNIAAEAESRILELSDFLIQGGFLVYFLARPFVLQSTSVAVDNYYWLETLAPDQPIEQNVRHMSAVAQGRLVEVTEKGTTSDLAPYLRQPGLEWSTIIRSDFLTDGYHLLATAGPNKCIAGQLFIMESNGRVAFLPCPFSPDFDKTLIDCLNSWYSQKEPSQEEQDAEKREAEELAAVNTIAVNAPSQGPQFFDKDQEEVSSGPSVFDSPSTEAIFTGESNTEHSSKESNLPDLTSEVVTDTILAEAQRFENAQQERQAAANIDLSIFAKTARQLVADSNTPPSFEAPPSVPPPTDHDKDKEEAEEEKTEEVAVADPEIQIPESLSPSEIEPLQTSDFTPQSPQDFAMPKIPELNSTDAVDSSIAEKIASDLVLESLQLDPPTPTSDAGVEDIAEPETKEIVSTSLPVNNGENAVTNNDNLQDEQLKKQKAMDALRELQQSHPQANPVSPPQPQQPTPPGHALPQQPAPQAPPPQVQASAPVPVSSSAPPPQPAQAPPQDQSSKPLLSNLFKKEDPAPHPEAPSHSEAPAQPRTAPAPQPVRHTNHANLLVPEWCKEFSFSYLDDLKSEQSSLSEQLHSVQAKLNTVESRIDSVEQLKQALLAGEPSVLIDACNTVLSRLGWSVRKSDKVTNEILLSNVEQPEGLARVVRSDDQCGRTEVAQLAESAISFWDEHEIEPKGVLIACTWSTISPNQRNQPDFSDSLRKFAEKKNLCLMTAMQLLGIYRDIEIGTTNPDVVRKQILETNGHLSGYEVEKGLGVGAGV